MKKRACILLMIFVALPLAILFLGKKTIYLPVRTEVYYSSAEQDEFLRTEIDYRYNGYGYLKELNYKNYWGRYTFDIDTDVWGNVTSCQGGLQISDDVLSRVSETCTYRWDGKLMSSASISKDVSYEWTYDFWGRLSCVKRVTNASHHSGGVASMIRYAYNAFGKLSSVQIYTLNEGTETLSSTVQIEYSWLGQRVAETMSSANSITKTSYNHENGKTIVYTTTVVGNNTMIFDHAGNLIEAYYTSDDYSQKLRHVHTYKTICVPIWFPRNAYVYTTSQPPHGYIDTNYYYLPYMFD